MSKLKKNQRPYWWKKKSDNWHEIQDAESWAKESTGTKISHTWEASSKRIISLASAEAVMHQKQRCGSFVPLLVETQEGRRPIHIWSAPTQYRPLGGELLGMELGRILPVRFCEPEIWGIMNDWSQSRFLQRCAVGSRRKLECDCNIIA